MKERIMTNSVKITNCYACGAHNLEEILNLNDQPLANSYLSSPDEEEDKFPLRINFCHDCYHVQLTDQVNPDLLYKNYLYVSGTTQTARDYFKWFADFCLEKFSGQPKSVLDIGCNDGSQLDAFKELGLETIGIDPAENLHGLSSVNHRVYCKYFDASFKETADIITAQNVFAHNYDPLGFLRLCSQALNPGGLIFIQTSQANMILNNEFDTIYHEHLSFYNAQSMSFLCERAGLHLVDVIKTPMHGTSYLFVISREQSQPSTLKNIIKLEAATGLYHPDTYYKYAENCKQVAVKFADEIGLARQQGYAIIGYGAPAKGNTFLNFANVRLDVIIDDNPMKQGLYTPGTRIPIVSVDVLNEYEIDDKIMFVPLAWNFFNEIKSRIAAVRSNPNDRFMRYFPVFEITRD